MTTFTDPRVQEIYAMDMPAHVKDAAWNMVAWMDDHPEADTSGLRPKDIASLAYAAHYIDLAGKWALDS